jgi:hypothetical protein
MEQTTVLDTHVHIPDFMKNQTWRKVAKNRRDKVLAVDNEAFYLRLLKAENSISTIKKDAIKHLETVGGMAKHMHRLKELDRLRKNVQIKRENHFLMARLHKARPNTSAKAMQKWYKHHADFRDGRRTDPTAGHIMKGMRGLLPAPLPPILTAASVLEKGSRASMTLSASPSNASLSAMDLDESSFTVDGGWSSQSSLMDKSSHMRSTGARGSTSVLSASGRKGLHTAPSVDGGGLFCHFDLTLQKIDEFVAPFFGQGKLFFQGFFNFF